MAKYIDKRILVSGGSSGFLNLQDPLNLATAVKQSFAESPTQGIAGSGLSTSTSGNIDLGGDLTVDAEVNGNGFDYTTTFTDTEFIVTGTSGGTSLAPGSSMQIQGDENTILLNYVKASGQATEVRLGMIGAENKLSLSITDDLGSQVVTLNLIQDDGSGNVGLSVEGLQEFADETAAAALDENSVYITTATRALTVKGAAGF